MNDRNQDKQHTEDLNDAHDGPQPLVDPVADLVAGDLTEAEAAQARSAIAKNDELQQQEAFWQRMQPTLHSAGRPTASTPGPHMAELIRKRLQQESATKTQAAPETQTPKVIAFPQWLQTLGAAVAAACIAVVLTQSLSSSPIPSQTDSQLVGFNEHGDAIYMPQVNQFDRHASLYQDDYIPLRRLEKLDAQQTKTIAHSTAQRPYLGLLIKPITLDNSHHETGALVLQVSGGSPADRAGMRPGDVILALADCPMATSYCIPSALKNKKPGEAIKIIYLDQSSGELVEKQITLSAAIE